MEAELELRARLLEQKHLRRRNRLRFLFLPFIWTASLLQALVDVGRNRPDIVEVPRPEAPAHSTAASLDSLPAARPHTPADDRASGPAHWAPPPNQPVAPVDYEVPGATEPQTHPEVEWPDEVEPAPPPRAPGAQAPHRDWRPAVEPPGAKTAPEQPPAPAAAPPPALAPPALAPPHWPGDEPAAPAEVPTAEIPKPEIPPADVPEREAPAPAPPVASPAPAPLPPQPTMALPPRPLPPQPTQQIGATELLGVILGTCQRSSGAEVGVVVLLQDDVLVMRASIGIEPEIAARLALETLGDLCLDVVGSAVPFRVYDATPRTPDPDHPRAILCVPILIADAGVGAILLAGYASHREFTAEHERLIANVARNAGPVLAKAGAYQLALDRPGDRWRRLDQVGSGAALAAPPAAPQAAPKTAPDAPPITEHGTGEIKGSPMSTMTLDPEAMRRLIAEAKAARAAEEAAAQAETVPQPPPAPPAPVEGRLPAWEEPDVAGEVQPPLEEQAVVAPVVEPELIEPPAPAPKKLSWRERVSSRMTQVAAQKEEDRLRYRQEILAAVRNLSWDGYQALIADIYRRKAFEVFPPPVSGTDLDVIDLVVDRDGKRMLINCQLRGEMDIPAAAVTEMGNVVYNYSVAGAYLIADGSFAADAIEAAGAGGVVLIDGEALIDLVIETTLKDESKPSGLSRFAKRLTRAS
jgi:Restriction endonuclease/GAF domain